MCQTNWLKHKLLKSILAVSLDPQFVQFSISCVRVCDSLSIYLYLYLYLYLYFYVYIYIYIFVLLAFDLATMQDRQS